MVSSKAVEKVKSGDKIVKVSPKDGTDTYGKAGNEYVVTVDVEELHKAVNDMMPVVYTDKDGSKVVKGTQPGNWLMQIQQKEKLQQQIHIN